MKCSNCGMQLPPSGQKCSRCGQAAVHKFNYKNMENELLNTVIEDEMADISGKSALYHAQKDIDDEEGRPETEAQRQPGKLGAALLISAAVFAVLFYCLQSMPVSYYYEAEQTEYQNCLRLIAQEDYDEALESAELLLENNEESLEYLALKNTICEKNKDTKMQKKVLKQIIALDQDNYPAYEKLLELYLAARNQKAIERLADKAPNSAISAMLRAYLVDAPKLELTPGIYDTSQSLAMSSENEHTIYYTLDGSSPLENGVQYYSPVSLEQDHAYKVRAVCKNDNGTYGEETTGEYQIGLDADSSIFDSALEQPAVYPDSGVYDTPQTIAIKVPIGCKAYYSWVLGTMLTPENGTLYKGGIPMPEGESILAVIVTDEDGNSSPVKQIHYTYQPQSS